MKIVTKDIFVKQMLNIQKIYSVFIEMFHSQTKERKLKSAKSFFAAYMTKKTMMCT